MYKIWTLEKEDGTTDFFVKERDAIVAHSDQDKYGPYKPTSVPKLGFSEHTDYNFIEIK